MQRRKFIAATGLSLLVSNKMFGQVSAVPEIQNKKRSHSIKTKVLVVGGGPAGIGAAIGAAKAGAGKLLQLKYI